MTKNLKDKFKQVGGTHYELFSYQPIQFFNDLNLDFTRSNTLKYITRHRNKDGLKDLNKAVQMCDFGIEFNNTRSVYVFDVQGKYSTKIKLFKSQFDKTESLLIDLILNKKYKEAKLIIVDIINSEYNISDKSCIDDDNIIRYVREYLEKDLSISLFKKVFKYNTELAEDDYFKQSAVIFALHKYDITNDVIMNLFKYEYDDLLIRIESCYKMLSKNKTFMFHLESVFSYVDINLKLCKK